ncbi:hypothetical protein ACFWIJ_40060 [Streptomyces sp. NPDC127079]|uniref:hypothetical protein n=1 Tax=Streptomyces sp. NPDC127079 TaxID=3347132 RepID=UPI00364AB66B
MTVAQPLTLRTADAWGQLLLDCHTAGLPRDAYFEICERDDGYISGYDAVGFFAGPDAWPALDRWAVDQVSGRVLELGGGAGRWAVAGQGRGGEIV